MSTQNPSSQSTTESSSGGQRPRARVLGVNGNIVRIQADSGTLMKNEVAFVRVGQERLKSEVLRVYGDIADLQVFEETDGVRFGDPVELTGQMLSLTLGPGMLGVIYDGLQNPLGDLAELDGFFLNRGRDLYPLDKQRTWDFEPSRRVGERVSAGDTLGYVNEKNIRHRIMAPFDLQGTAEILSIEMGSQTVEQTIARLRDDRGREREVTMTQDWPVRRPIPQYMQRARLVQRRFPTEPLITTTRTIDTFFPVARGGTACVPGPFGAGKTVLQGLIARYCAVDIVIVVACGERAGEVVETIHDFAEMNDPRTGGKLMDRTIIICNTSSMPVACARHRSTPGSHWANTTGRWGSTSCCWPTPPRAGAGDARNVWPAGRDSRGRSVSCVSRLGHQRCLRTRRCVAVDRWLDRQFDHDRFGLTGGRQL